MDEILNEEIEPQEEFIIPNIYRYSPQTMEYTGFSQCEKDPEESKVQGRFIPLVPANSTLLEVPEYEENEIPVYSRTIETHQEPYEVIDPETGETHIEYKEVTEIIENWDIQPDYRQNFLKVDNDLNVYDITTIGEQEGFIIVTKEVGDDIKADKDWYKIVDNKVVKKSKKEYEQKQYDRREAEFNKSFFNTSLGYVRRSVTMADSSKKDFLSDLLPVISMGVQSGQSVNILTYDKPPFDEDIEDWTEYQHLVTVTQQFISECFVQLSNDFAPINEE